MTNNNISRVPNLAKVAIAILESKIEPFVGKGTIKEIKVPYEDHLLKEKLYSALNNAERKFIQKYPNSEVAKAVGELPIADLPSIKLAIYNYYQFPTNELFVAELQKQLRIIVPRDQNQDVVIAATLDFLRLFWDEAIILDELRNKLQALSIFSIQDNTYGSMNLLKSIDEKIGKMVEYIDVTPIQSVNSSEKYLAQCSVSSPGLIIYLVDIGRNTQKMVNGVPAIQLISDAVRSSLIGLISRSLRQGNIFGRYYVGCFAYCNDVFDMYGGLKPISGILDVPTFHAIPGNGDTLKAFSYVWQVLEKQVRNYGRRPAPLVCHITAGEYPGRDPEPLAEKIKSLEVQDGEVLLENVLVDDEAVLIPTANLKSWSGIHTENELAKSYARQLFRMSSVLPESYRESLNFMGGYNLSKGIRMLFPATVTEIIRLAVSHAVTTASRGINE